MAHAYLPIMITQIEVREHERLQSGKPEWRSLDERNRAVAPVESSYERVIANRLVSAGQAFYRPMG